MDNHLNVRKMRRRRRALRVRKRVRGDAQQPRLSVFRSNKHLGAQVIDDEKQVTLFGMSTLSKECRSTDCGKKSMNAAHVIGRRIAEEAKKRGITRVVLDRGFYKYHGLIAALADAAREAGLAL